MTAAIAGAVVVGGLAIAAIVLAATGSSSQANARACDATSVSNKVAPSVVTINVQSGLSGSTGSGEVIRSDGYILTNNHVVSSAANGGEIKVVFSNGETVPATITGRDPAADIAVIKVTSQASFPVIPMGSSAHLDVGEPVVAMGAPLGLSGTVTSGIVSALDRSVQVPSDNGQTALLVSAIQTDASINPGNSGGALMNCSGQLVGVPSAGATVPSPNGGSSAGSIGLNFAIPIDVAEPIANEIISTGTVTHGYFGLNVTTVPPNERTGSKGGIYVQSVVPGGPAAQAGLQAGDVITEINGEPATSTDQLAAITITHRAGDTVTITYERNGQTQTTKVTLGSAP